VDNFVKLASVIPLVNAFPLELVKTIEIFFNLFFDDNFSSYSKKFPNPVSEINCESVG